MGKNWRIYYNRIDCTVGSLLEYRDRHYDYTWSIEECIEK